MLCVIWSYVILNIVSLPFPFRSWCMWAFWQRNLVMCSVQKCWRVARSERWSNGQISSPPFMCWVITSRYHSQSKNCKGKSRYKALASLLFISKTFALALFMIWWPVQMCFSCIVLTVTLKCAQIHYASRIIKGAVCWIQKPLLLVTPVVIKWTVVSSFAFACVCLFIVFYDLLYFACFIFIWIYF